MQCANAELGDRFLHAAERAQARLIQFPHIGSEVRTFHPRLSGLRFWPVPDFERYLLFYLVFDDQVEIVRVLDGARDLLELLGVGGDET